MNFIYDKNFQKMLVVTLIVVGIWVLTVNIRENFSDYKESPYQPCSELEKKYLNSEDFLANGSVFKYKNGDVYDYVYRFNLPIPEGGDFSKAQGDYEILAGTTKDNLKSVGKLQRKGDGSFDKDFSSEEDFIYTRIDFVDKGVKIPILSGYI